METARLIRKSFFESWRKRACIERVHLCCPANHATFARLEQWLWQRMIACKHVVIFSVKVTVSGLSVHLSQCMYNVVEWKPFRAKDQTFDAWLPKLWFAWLCETFAQCRFLVYLCVLIFHVFWSFTDRVHWKCWLWCKHTYCLVGKIWNCDLWETALFLVSAYVIDCAQNARLWKGPSVHCMCVLLALRVAGCHQLWGETIP